jgi:hypothetical protein
MPPLPEVIPIAYRPAGRTGQIGRYLHGQFVGGVVSDPEWFSSRHRFTSTVVLHLFDAEGRHTGSEFMPGISDIAVADEALSGLIGALGQTAFGDVAIRSFSLKAHGRVWGLEAREGNPDWVDLEPQELAFHEPWDGSYLIGTGPGTGPGTDSGTV